MSTQISFFLLSFLLLSCKKTEFPSYQGDNSVYFYVPTYSYGKFDYALKDSTNVYLGYNDLDTTLLLNIRLVGNVVNSDRSYNLIVDNDSTDLKENIEYELITDRTIKSSQSSSVVEVLIKNNKESISTKPKALYLNLLENENFKCSLDLAIGGNDIRNNSWRPYRYKINLIYYPVKPYFWDKNIDYLGVFSPEKIRLMTKFFPLSVKSLIKDNGSVYNDSNIRDIARKFQNYLYSESKNGTLILESDGSQMKMGIKVI